MHKFFLFCLVVAGFSSCKDSGKRELLVHVAYAPGQTLFLANIPFQGDTLKVLDSVKITQINEDVRFTLPASTEESLYRLRTPDEKLNIVVIADRPEVEIKADYGKPDFSFVSGGANQVLFDFFKKLASLKAPEADLGRIRQQKLSAFADTVSSAGAALYAFAYIDFGADRKALRAAIDKLKGRFPTNPVIARLYKETDRLLSVSEMELHAGDKAPDFALADSSGKQVRLSSLKGRYIFLDFWATWCPNCLLQNPVKEQLMRTKAPGLVLVGVALDSDVPGWKEAVRKERLADISLIDTKIWTGDGVYAFKFDSIPSNYLIDPSGKIVATNLRGDSLLSQMRRLKLLVR